MHPRIAAAILAGLLSTSAAYAVTLHDETVSGDISSTQAAPNAFSVVAGTNSIIGNFHITTANDSQDWVTLTVPAGHTLNSVVLGAYTSTDAQGFAGFQVGSAFVGMTNNPANYAGFAHFGTGATNGTLPATNTIGVDHLPIMADNSPTGTSPGASGFTIPLGPGTYAFLIQQTGTTPTNYRFDFNVVPEPASIGFLALGATGALLRRRSRA